MDPGVRDQPVFRRGLVLFVTRPSPTATRDTGTETCHWMGRRDQMVDMLETSPSLEGSGPGVEWCPIPGTRKSPTPAMMPRHRKGGRKLGQGLRLGGNASEAFPYLGADQDLWLRLHIPQSYNRSSRINMYLKSAPASWRPVPYRVSASIRPKTIDWERRLDACLLYLPTWPGHAS